MHDPACESRRTPIARAAAVRPMPAARERRSTAANAREPPRPAPCAGRRERRNPEDGHSRGRRRRRTGPRREGRVSLETSWFVSLRKAEAGYFAGPARQELAVGIPW